MKKPPITKRITINRPKTFKFCLNIVFFKYQPKTKTGRTEIYVIISQIASQYEIELKIFG